MSNILTIDEAKRAEKILNRAFARLIRDCPSIGRDAGRFISVTSNIQAAVLASSAAEAVILAPGGIDHLANEAARLYGETVRNALQRRITMMTTAGSA